MPQQPVPRKPVTLRYFRATTADYQSICQQLDAAYGYPNEESLTQRALPLAESLPSDSAGRVYVAIASAQCDLALSAELLATLLANGTVEELTHAEWANLFPPQPKPPRRIKE